MKIDDTCKSIGQKLRNLADLEVFNQTIFPPQNVVPGIVKIRLHTIVYSTV
jgi:hypothetical protein